jgi:HEAT repeat protein
VRAEAAASLGAIGLKAGIAPPAELVAALQEDPSVEMRTALAVALSQFRTGADAAIPHLFDALVTGEISVRRTCILALRNPNLLPSPALVPYLVQTVRQGRDARERCAAASLLGRLGPAAREAVPALIATLSEPPGLPPAPLAVTGGETAQVAPFGKAQPVARGDEPAQDSDPACESAQALVLITIGTPASDQAVAALIETLRSKYWWRPGAVARALMPMGSVAAKAVPALAAALSQSVAVPQDRGNESWIARALGEIAPSAAPSPEAIKSLTEALGSTHVGTRAYSAQSLGRFGRAATASVPRLRALLNDPSPFVRRSAQTALGAIEPLVGVDPKARGPREGPRSNERPESRGKP